MRETGIVVENKGMYAGVAVVRKTACGENCASCKGGCTPTETVLGVKNSIGAKVGDRVILELPDKKAIGAAAIVYLLPLVSLFFGACAAAFFKLGEGICALSGALAMGVCFLIMYFTLGKKSRSFEVEIVKILGNNSMQKPDAE